MTPKVSSNCFTNSDSSMRVSSLKASSSSSVVSFAMMGVLSHLVPGRTRGVTGGYISVGEIGSGSESDRVLLVGSGLGGRVLVDLGRV